MCIRDRFPPFTAWTTRVSNPVRSPCFRFSASVVAQRPAFAIGVPPDICAFHRYTRNSSLPYHTLVCPVSYTHLRAHETVLDLVCRLLLEKKKKASSTLAYS